MESRTMISAVLVLVAFASGFRLHRGGRPFGTFVFTVHKLSAVGAAIYAGLLMHNLFQAAAPGTTAIAAIVVASISTTALFVSGAIMSIRKSPDERVLSVHNISAVLTVAAGCTSIYLLS